VTFSLAQFISNFKKGKKQKHLIHKSYLNYDTVFLHFLNPNKCTNAHYIFLTDFFPCIVRLMRELFLWLNIFHRLKEWKKLSNCHIFKNPFLGKEVFYKYQRKVLWQVHIKHHNVLILSKHFISSGARNIDK